MWNVIAELWPPPHPWGELILVAIFVWLLLRDEQKAKQQPPPKAYDDEDEEE